MLAFVVYSYLYEFQNRSFRRKEIFLERFPRFVLLIDIDPFAQLIHFRSSDGVFSHSLNTSPAIFEFIIFCVSGIINHCNISRSIFILNIFFQIIWNGCPYNCRTEER